MEISGEDARVRCVYIRVGLRACVFLSTFLFSAAADKGNKICTQTTDHVSGMEAANLFFRCRTTDGRGTCLSVWNERDGCR